MLRRRRVLIPHPVLPQALPQRERRPQALQRRELAMLRHQTVRAMRLPGPPSASTGAALTRVTVAAAARRTVRPPAAPPSAASAARRAATATPSASASGATTSENRDFYLEYPPGVVGDAAGPDRPGTPFRTSPGHVSDDPIRTPRGPETCVHRYRSMPLRRVYTRHRVNNLNRVYTRSSNPQFQTFRLEKSVLQRYICYNRVLCRA